MHNPILIFLVLNKTIHEEINEPKHVNGKMTAAQNTTHKILLFSEPGASNNIGAVIARKIENIPMTAMRRLHSTIAKRFKITYPSLLVKCILIFVVLRSFLRVNHSKETMGAE
ncbi:MAG: hypothetical protein SFW66_04405 [Gammaproteobacteria bacterium]|nr:hypothetical protein [Gammaproteobacteria bacterium]